MASWADQGHAMRRRSGNPSAHSESAGAPGARTHETMDEQYAAASGANSAWASVGRCGADCGHDHSSPDLSQDNRATERHGAQYRVTAKVPGTVDPTVGPTVASGRIVPQFPGQSLNFETAIQYAQL